MKITTAREPAVSAAQDVGDHDWPGSPMSTLHHVTERPLSIPIEQYSDGDDYVIRLEVPGVDPVRDLTVTVETGTLVVRAVRRDDVPDDGQSEFRHGEMSRSVSLPLGANPREVSARCHDGILTVRIGMDPEHRDTARSIPVVAET